MRGLGELEKLILLAIVRLDGDASGVTVLRELESRAGRDVSPGAIYTALGRLQDRGFVREVSPDDREAQEGPGRPRKYYRATRRAAASLLDAHQQWSAMADGQLRALERLVTDA